MPQGQPNQDPAMERAASGRANPLSPAPQSSLRRTMARGAVYSTLGAGVARGCALVASVLVAQNLGKEVTGQWGLVITAVGMFANVAVMGAGAFATRYVAALRQSDPVRASRVLSLALAVGLVVDIAVSAIAFALAGTMATTIFGVPELERPLQLAAVLLFVMVTAQMLQCAVLGFESFGGNMWIELVQGVALLAGTVVLVPAFGLSGIILAMCCSWALAAILSGSLVLHLCRRHGMRLSLRNAWPERRMLLHGAVPSVLTGGLTGLGATISQGVVSHLPGGVAGLGGYKAATDWRNVVQFLPGALNRITLPILSRLTGQNDQQRYLKALGLNVALSGGASLLGSIPILLLGRWILGFYGPAFVDDWDILAILLAAGVVCSVGDVVWQVLWSKEKFWWGTGIVAIWAVLLWAGTQWLTPAMGVRGFAWAFLGAYAAQALLCTAAAISLLKRE